MHKIGRTNSLYCFCIIMNRLQNLLVVSKGRGKTMDQMRIK